MALTDPAPGGTIGRTDAGVDWSAIRGNIGAVASGIISNVYQGLSGFGYTIIEKIKANQYIYYGLETGGTPIGVKEGQSVTQGQALAKGLGSGGIEVGYWDQATGRPVGRFDGSDPTTAGQTFRSRISRNSASGNSTLAQLWIQAGGPPSVANLMAAIAMAESGGQVGVVSKKNANGTVDRGLWQINSSHNYDPQRLVTDPLYNAQAAVAIYKSQGLQAWSTYNSGAYKSFTSTAASLLPNYGGPNGGVVRPGGQPPDTSGSSGVDEIIQDYVKMRDLPRTAPPQTKNPFQWWLASFTGNWNNVQ